MSGVLFFRGLWAEKTRDICSVVEEHCHCQAAYQQVRCVIVSASKEFCIQCKLTTTLATERADMPAAANKDSRLLKAMEREGI